MTAAILPVILLTIVVFTMIFKVPNIENLPLELAYIYLSLGACGYVLVSRGVPAKFYWKQALGVGAFFILVFGLFLASLGDVNRLFQECIWNVPLSLIVKIVSLNLAVSVLEEVLFRRYLLNLCLEHLSAFWSILISSLIFFFLHGTFLPTPFLLGVVLASLAIHLRSITPGIVLHLIFNVIIFIGETPQLKEFQFVGRLDGGSALRSANFVALFLTAIVVFLWLSLEKVVNGWWRRFGGR